MESFATLKACVSHVNSENKDLATCDYQNIKAREFHSKAY